MYSFYPIRNSVRNRVWPTTTNNLVLVCGVSQYLMVYQPPYFGEVTQHLNQLCDLLPLPVSESKLVHFILSCSKSLRYIIIVLLVSYNGISCNIQLMPHLHVILPLKMKTSIYTPFKILIFENKLNFSCYSSYNFFFLWSQTQPIH